MPTGSIKAQPVDHQMMFGPGNTFTYVSPRQNYAGVEQGYGSFMGAMQKSLGAAGSAKLMQDFSNCLSSTRGEFRAAAGI